MSSSSFSLKENRMKEKLVKQSHQAYISSNHRSLILLLSRIASIDTVKAVPEVSSVAAESCETRTLLASVAVAFASIGFLFFSQTV